MRFYKLSAGELAKINAINATRKNTLLIVCDHGEGNLGIDADAVESPAFKDYFAELGNLLEPIRLVELDLTAVRATLISKSSVEVK